MASDFSAAHRGTPLQPGNRFAPTHLDPDPDSEIDPNEEPLPRTQFLADQTQTILTSNDSPDIGFTHSLNAYRGCEHGCIYCYARPFHEYLGFSAGLDFETRILVKHEAPQLLRKELSSPRWKPEVIAMSGVTDCYQPIERKLRITRSCLEVLAEFRNPVGIVTKNSLVTRDLDLLKELARHRAVVVFLSLTTLDAELRSILEPRTSPPASRLSTLGKLRDAGIPAGVMIAPIIPAINDHEIPQLVSAAAKAGAQFAGRVVLRLPYAVAPLFEDWLVRNFPDRKDKVLQQIRSLRGGELNDSRFGNRMRGEGPAAERIEQLFQVACRRAGVGGRHPELSTTAFRRGEAGQLDLF